MKKAIKKEDQKLVSFHEHIVDQLERLAAQASPPRNGPPQAAAAPERLMGAQEPLSELSQQLRGLIESKEYAQQGESSLRKLQYLSKNIPQLTPHLNAQGPSRLFRMDEIPSLSVWEGDCCEFYVDWKDHPQASFQLSALPPPKGSLSLQQGEDADGRLSHFSYWPSAEDKFPFVVTLQVRDGEQTQSHSFEITPLPRLVPEQTVIGLDKEIQPHPVDFDKPVTEETIHTHTYYQDPKFSFNGKRPSLDKDLELREVTLIGETITFDEHQDDFGLYRVFQSPQDLEKLTIVAKTLVIRSPLLLHQTEVVIKVKDLFFEGEGAQIKTTPVENKTTTGTGDKGGLPGVDGLPAGSIALNVEENGFQSDSQINFDLTGGRGQDGGYGKDGDDGRCMRCQTSYLVWSDASYFPGAYREWLKLPEGYCITYVRETGFKGSVFLRGVTYEWGDENNWPSDGQDALPNGKPGRGGNGGVLTSNIDVSCHAVMACGSAGLPPTFKPNDEYTGGLAGTPHKAIRYHIENDLVVPWGWHKDTELGRHTTKAGKSAEVVYEDNKDAKPGRYEQGGNPYAWIQSRLIHHIFRRAKDEYLANRVNSAETIMREYLEHLEAYRKDASWNDLDSKEQFDLEQMSEEMQILLHRIKNNLDYFGHPAGWVPLLSFEVTRKIFDNEVDRAIERLYAAYCIQNKARTAEETFDSLTQARKQLEDDLSSAAEDYSTALRTLPHLKNQAKNLDQLTQVTQNKLRGIEERLEREAEETVKARGMWLVVVRTSLKVCGTVCSMIPVGQPVVGVVGSGLTLASNFDPNRPWDSIVGTADIGAAFLKSGFDDASKDLKNKLDKNKQSKLEDADPKGKLQKNIAYLEKGKDATAALSAGLKDMQIFMEKNSAPQSEVDVELEKLVSQSKEYHPLVKEIKELMKQKKDLAEQLAMTMQKIAGLSHWMKHSILTMDAMNCDLAHVQAGLDKRVRDYVADIEKQSYDRLLQYHYYMAKAYEYRLLKPYSAPLDFKKLIKRLEEVEHVDSWDKLDASTFKSTYKMVYEERLSEIANEIFDGYINLSQEQTGKLEYSLNDEELALLNAQGTLTVNFANYLPNEENLRIVDVGILTLNPKKRKGDIQTSCETETYPRNAYLDLNIVHPAVSKLRSGSTVYQFNHPYLGGPNPLQWKTRYTPESDIVDPSGPSAASESLLKSLLKGDALSDLMLYSRPSVWTNLEISKSGYPKQGKAIHVTRLTLELTYDYFRSETKMVDKQVVVTKIHMGDGTAVQASEANFQPYFIVEREDKNHRKDARGAFLRIYEPDYSSELKITAQPRYGKWVFNKWTDVEGKALSLTQGETITLDLRHNEVLCAQYIWEDHKKIEALRADFPLSRAADIATVRK